MVSRALQVACTEPRGPVYLSIAARSVAREVNGAQFPTMDQLGVARPAAPDADGIREHRAAAGESGQSVVVVRALGPQSGDGAGAGAAVRAAGAAGRAVGASAPTTASRSTIRSTGRASLTDADVVLVLDVDIPWIADTNAPPDNAWVAVIDVEPSKRRIPTMEFTADLRLTADALLGDRGARSRRCGRSSRRQDQRRFAARPSAGRGSAKRRHDARRGRARRARATRRSIRTLAVVPDRAGARRQLHRVRRHHRLNQVHDYSASRGRAPISTIRQRAAAGRRARRSAPSSRRPNAMSSRSPATASTCSARRSTRCGRRRTTTRRSDGRLPEPQLFDRDAALNSATPDSFAVKAGYDGGYFDPPIDFAKEAEAAGAYGENVTDPAEVEPALRRGLERIRAGQPAVISVWLARLLQKD